MRHIYSTNYAFAALKAGGSVVSWGSNNQYSFGVEDFDQSYRKVQAQLSLDVQHIYAQVQRPKRIKMALQSPS